MPERDTKPERTIYDSISPIDYRYWESDAAEHLSENGFTEWKRKFERELLRAVAHRLAPRGLAPADAVAIFEERCPHLPTQEVYEEERITRHDIQALVNCIKRRLPPELARLIHIPDTSWDDVCTANAGRFKLVIETMLLPELLTIERVLIRLARNEASTICVGRTHRQHAVPITFGFYMAEYVDRLGGCIVSLRDLVGNLVGKSSGLTGSFNAATLLFDDVEAFEAEVVGALGLKPGRYSKQITNPEEMTRLFLELQLVAGVLANFSRDVCNLLRPELAELLIPKGKGEVGSSTAKHKINPIVYENADSWWKVSVGKFVTILLDQINEGQRVLDNSLSSRMYAETIMYLLGVARRLAGAIPKLVINRERMRQNLNIQGDLMLAEKLSVMLAVYGNHSQAGEKADALSTQARQEGKTLESVALQDETVRAFLVSLPPDRRDGFFDVTRYIGIAPQRAFAVARYWAERLNINPEDSEKEKPGA